MSHFGRSWVLTVRRLRDILATAADPVLKFLRNHQESPQKVRTSKSSSGYHAIQTEPFEP